MEETNLKFLTGSSYKGTFNKDINCMDGYGVYLYPDGSEYRGLFRRGQFHGFGTLKMARPHNFTVRGFFKKGVLKNYQQMIFEDGLRFSAKCDGENLDMKHWKYCNGNERRFRNELFSGIPSVGPESYVTPNKPARPIPRRTYDIEEGLYSPNSYFVRNRQTPLHRVGPVVSKEERDWIETNCRKMFEKHEYKGPTNEIGKQVLKNNLDELMTVTDIKKQCCPKCHKSRKLSATTNWREKGKAGHSDAERDLVDVGTPSTTSSQCTKPQSKWPVEEPKKLTGYAAKIKESTKTTVRKTGSFYSDSGKELIVRLMDFV